MIRFASCIAAVLMLVATATAAKGPVTDEQYTADFNQHFHKRNTPVTLKEIASVQLYDSRYMGHSLDELLTSNLQKLGGNLAWGVAYRMISLNEMFRVTRNPKYLQANLRCINAVLAVRDDHTGTKVRGQALPAWSTARYTGKRTVFLVHTAMIIYPMLQAIHLAQTSPGVPAETKADLEKLLPTVLQSLHLHDSQWRNGPGRDEGCYVGHDQESAFNGKPLPINRLSAMGRCLWTAWLITKDLQYRTKALALGWYIKRRLSIGQDGAYYWAYSLSKNPVTNPVTIDRYTFPGEDTSHATLSVSFPIMLAENHEIFTEQDMHRFAKTVTDGWAKLGNGVLFGNISGSPRSSPKYIIDPAGWLCLSAYDPAVKAHILPFYLNYEQRYYPSYKQHGRPEALAALVALRDSAAADADKAVGITYVVDQRAANATDDGPGTAAQPFKTISKAASLAGPGDTVLVHAGLYREWVAPARGGEEGRPVTYEAAKGEKVIISGSEIYHGKWDPVKGHPGVYTTKPPDDFFTAGFDPFKIRFPAARGGGTQGQVFLDGKELTEAMGPHTYIEQTGGWKLAEPRMQVLYEQPGTWWTQDGETIYVHVPDGAKSLAQSTVEFSVRRRLFGPLRRCQNYIIVRGFIFEDCANDPALPQVGAVSCRSGQHWIIEDNTIRNVKTIGLDCGAEGYSPSSVRQLPDTVAADRFLVGGNEDDFTLKSRRIAGRHLILNNHISDCGQCGIAGLFSDGTVIAGNVIERCGGVISGFESAGIKIHGLMHGTIEGNLVRDCDAFGIWLDCGWVGARITRNVVVNNSPAGIFLEICEGPGTVDNNIVAYNRGCGIYTHDASGAFVAHNLIFGNTQFGIYQRIVSDRRAPGYTYATGRRWTRAACSWERIYNNVIVDNAVGTINQPLACPRVQDNRSDYNLFGSSPEPVQFVINSENRQTPGGDAVANAVRQALGKNDPSALPKADFKRWKHNHGVFLNLVQWRAATGNDQHSAVTSDHYKLNMQTYELDETGTPPSLVCPPAPLFHILDFGRYTRKIDLDFLGQPIVGDKVRPGAFQSVERKVVVWPVKFKRPAMPPKVKFTPPPGAPGLLPVPHLWGIVPTNRNRKDLAAEYADRFPNDVNFTVDKSDASKDFSGIQPGPADAWAGSRQHPFTITFDLPKPLPGSYDLLIKIANTSKTHPPVLRIKVNDQETDVALEPGKPRVLRYVFGSDVLKPTGNHIELRIVKGSWLLYNSVKLIKLGNESDAPIKVTAGPASIIKDDNGSLHQQIDISAYGLLSRADVTAKVLADHTIIASANLGKPVLGAVSGVIFLPPADKPRQLTVKLSADIQTGTAPLLQTPQGK